MGKIKKIFSRGFFLGFFVILLLVAIFSIIHRLFAVIEGRPPVPIAEAIIAALAWAMFGAIAGRWLDNLWNVGKRVRVIGFLFGTGLYFLFTTLSAIRVLRVLILVNLPGLIIVRGAEEPFWGWTTLILSWLTWSFMGWVGGLLSERVSKGV